METVIVVIGVVSAILGIIDFFISRFTARKWWPHVLYVVFISVLAGIATYQASQMARLSSISRAADALEGQRTRYTHRGYVFAVLAFLEKNKDLLPDTYARAQAACEAFQCNRPGTDYDMVELAFALHGIVRGIGTIEGNR